MKKTNIIYFFLFLFVLIQPITAYADMGPKPFIYVNFENIEDRTVYATFFASEGGPSPVSFGDWDRTPEDIRKEFKKYSETEPARFLDDVWIINNDQPSMDCGYMPPRTYKLVVYIPDERRFLESDFYTRELFEEIYTVDLMAAMQSGKIVMVRKGIPWTRTIVSVILRVVFTLLIEIGIAFMFLIKGKKALQTIIITNLLTQLFLNVCISYKIIFSGRGLGMLIMIFFLEIIIFIVEAIIYSIALKKTNNPPVSTARAVGYAFSANLASFLIGFII